MTIARAVVDDVVAHARECRPRECCGVLIGAGDRITGHVRCRNTAEHPTRFVLDPSDHIAARRSARDSGREIVGFYHSHPHSAARPSVTDLEEAAYPECVHLIVGLPDGGPDVRIYRYANGVATELPHTVVDA